MHVAGRRGIHSRPHSGFTDEWLTPPPMLRALGHFDLDPCAHPGQEQGFATADVMFSLPFDDGLTRAWFGRVFLNPPYGSELKKWMKKMAEHGNGIALVPARTEVQTWFWPYIWEAADAILFLKGRISFYLPDGSTKGNAGHGSVLAAYGSANVAALEKSNLAGRLVYRGR